MILPRLQAESNAAPVITSLQQFWELPPAEKAKPQAMALECTVTYFDPVWHILFVQDTNGTATYVVSDKNSYPFKVGETVLAEGTLQPPNVDVSFENASITPRPALRLEPISASEDVAQYSRYHGHLVTVEGYVDRERRSDDQHLQLTLSVKGQSVFCWVIMDARVPTPDLTNRKVRLTGAYNAHIGPDGTMVSFEVMVGAMTQIEVFGHLDDDPGFKLPVSPINSLPKLPADRLVRVVGTVVSREPGRLLRIRDGSGQIDLITGQLRSLGINDLVEAIGYPGINGLEWRLESAMFRPLAKPATTNDGKPAGPIGLAAEVMRLTAVEADQHRPVHLTGVVTWSNPNSRFFFIHDSSGGVCVMRGKSTSVPRSPGRNVEVQGVTSMGPFAPVIVADRFERVSEAILPMARRVSVEHAMTGVEEAQWVEMSGYLRRTYREGDWNYLELATATSDFIAVVPPTEDLSSMVGSTVRLHGVCTADADAQRKLTGIKLWVPGIAYAQVLEPAPEDPFSVPQRSLATLGQFETVQAFNRRVHVSGVVLHQTPGHSIHLVEGGHALLVLTRSAERFNPGDRIDAVGFLGRESGRLTLREAVCRPQGAGQQPLPKPLVPDDQPDAAADGQLVRIEGLMIGGSVVEKVAQLSVQTTHKIFDASIETPGADFELPANGSRIALVGVYEVSYDEHGRAESFSVRLRTPADLVVLETPSWFTRARILAFTGVLALGALLFLGWVTVLRRQVQRQTDLIRLQVEREARLQAELARGGKLESLGLLAGGIAHDFNNLLTVLMGNMSLIRLDNKLSAETARSLAQAEKAATRARDLTQQLLTFAKGGAPLRTAVALPEVVREVAEFALHGSTVRCTFDSPRDLWPANVDKGQISQVVQNIVINALQAMPGGGKLEIALSNREIGGEFNGVLAPGRYVRIDFTDHGPGIAPVDLARVFDPYFTTKKQGSGLGLATVHSIVKKHAGHVTAESQIGKGTVFQVWLPAAAAEVVKDAEGFAAASARPPATNCSGAARVLLMDDEEFIRELGGSILRRYGYQSTTVADGVAAVTEYTRAQQSGEPYDLVILDLTIPGGKGGRETIEELVRLDPEVKAIVSSGYSNDLVLSNYQAHGFRAIVSKPYDVADFAHAVDRVLKGERS